jgi:hypothetical protein
LGRAKDPEDRVRRNKPREPVPEQEIEEWDGIIRGPELPDVRNWHSETYKWWHTWRCSPQAAICTETDWESMKVAAIVYDRIQHGVSDTALANLTGELRKREGMFGASYEDRRRLGLGIRKPVSDNPEEDERIENEVNRAVDYFSRMSNKYGSK